MTLVRAMPVILVAWPLLAACFVPLLGRGPAWRRDAWMLLVTGSTVLGTLVLVAGVLEQGRVAVSVPFMLGRMVFAVDHAGALFALFSAFVWFCATLYSLAWLRGEPRQGRYHAVSLAVLAANLGVVVAGDLLTLYLFFELLGLSALLLIVHQGTEEARRAAIQYFWMTLFGGVALLAGILIVQSLGGGLLAPLPAGAGSDGQRAAAAALMVLGFGVKAGMVPVHVWLPRAHPVAPAPASALLSGVMIKAGAYGIYRTVDTLFRPAAGIAAGDASWQFHAQLGLAVLWLGILTMAVGVVLALGQRNAKRMLAYHSISQVGFILAGLGAGAYLGGEGAMGTAGGLMHAVNHALFKASLFLGMGAVALRAGSADMYALGGLWRSMPWTFALMLVAAAGITGMPLFNGFVSKCLVHHALEAAHAVGEAPGLGVAERIYLLVCAGTAASFIKLIGLVFLGRPRGKNGGPVQQSPREAPFAMLLAMALLAVPVVVLGVRPGLLLEGLIGPALVASGLPDGALEPFLEHYFLSAGDLLTASGTLLLGGALFAAGMRFGWFHLHAPAWMGLDCWYRRAGRGVVAACEWAVIAHGRLRRRASWLARRGLRRLQEALRVINRRRRQATVELREHPAAWLRAGRLDEAAGIAQTRLAIQRYARDVSLNIASIFLLLALFAAVLWLGA